MKLVDGRGARRVIRAMGVSALLVRSATRTDSARLFEWRNHPEIRAVSRCPDVIDWRTHAAWFESVVANPQRPLLIGERAGATVGVVRFDITSDRAEVSIYKVPGPSEPETGQELLAAAENWLVREYPAVRVLTAEVLGDNQASHGLFAAAGYSRSATRYTKRIYS